MFRSKRDGKSRCKRANPVGAARTSSAGDLWGDARGNKQKIARGAEMSYVAVRAGAGPRCWVPRRWAAGAAEDGICVADLGGESRLGDDPQSVNTDFIAVVTKRHARVLAALFAAMDHCFRFCRQRRNVARNEQGGPSRKVQSDCVCD